MSLFFLFHLTLVVLYISSSKGEVGNDGSLRESRIYNGENVAKDQYDYFAVTEKSLNLCGGVLIADNVILTAAHCYGAFSSQAGIGKHSVTAKSSEYESIGVLKEIQHPEYDGGPSLDNDFMLVILEERSNIEPVCMADTSTVLNVGDELTVMGFGTTETGLPSPKLKEAKVDYLTNERCRSLYYNYFLISENMMCAQSEDSQDACQGDSGGPLIMKGGDGDKSDVLVGIVSWGVGCGLHPGVYSRVSSQQDWIRDTVQEYGGNVKMCGLTTSARDPNTEETEVEYEKNYESLCQTDSGNYGKEGDDFIKYSDTSKDECEDKCSAQEDACSGFEWNKKKKCEIWSYKSKKNKTKTGYWPMRNEAVCYWKEKNGD